MGWYVLSGRNVSFRVGKWPSNFETTVGVIQDVLDGLSNSTALPAGVTVISNPCFLNDVGIEMSAGITPIVAIGVENIAALEEFVVRAQNIRTRFTVQSQAAGATSGPIDFIHEIMKGATRLGTLPGQTLYHLPPYFLDFFVIAPRVGGAGIDKVWRVCAPFAFVRNLRWAQRPEDAAQVEITWFVPYVHFADIGDATPPLVQYNPSAGVFIVREVVFDAEVEAGTENVLDLSALANQRIVTDFTVEINNDLREVFTVSKASDITGAGSDKIRRLLRVFNSIFEGRSTITSNFTIVHPGGLSGSLNLALPQALKKISFTYYEAAGTGASADAPTPIYRLVLRMAKVLDSRINFAQEQMITLGVSVQALDLDAELRPAA
jgi:hypothetical protein